MANQPEVSNFDAGVYQIEITDPLEGGPGGVLNAPLLALANRTKYLLDQITEMKKKLPRFRGYITGIDIGSGTIGANVTKSGDIVAATIFSKESGGTGVGDSTTILVTIPSMGNTNYFVVATPESRGTIEDDNDCDGLITKVSSATQFFVSAQQSFGSVQNLRVNIQVISWDA